MGIPDLAATYTQERLLEDIDAPEPYAHFQMLFEGAGSAEKLMQQADPVDGWVRAGIVQVRVLVTAKQNELSPICYRFGSWAVTSYGIESLTEYYPIPRRLLHQVQHWADHLSRQPWVCLEDVARALVVAQHLYPAGQPDGGTQGGANEET